MNKAHLFDDISVRKNEFFYRMTKVLPVYWIVCSEFTKQSPTKMDNHIVDEDIPSAWRTFETYPLLRSVDASRAITEPKLWHDQVPGLAGVNAEPIPTSSQDRKEWVKRAIDSANACSARVAFFDVSTGLATANMDQKGNNKSLDARYLYWSDLKQAVDSFKGIVCFYQHSRWMYAQPAWTELWAEVEKAIDRPLGTIEEDPVTVSLARAKLVFAATTTDVAVISDVCRRAIPWKSGSQRQ